LETHFFLTSLVQATVLGICGDIAAQNVEVLVRGGLLRAGGLEGGIVAGVQRLLQGFKPDWVRTRNVAVLTTAIGGRRREGESEGGGEGGRAPVGLWPRWCCPCFV